MRLETLYLENFGRFEQKLWRFEPGFNHFYAENEYGKSTMLDGLLLIFYGAETRKRDARENLRLRYLDAQRPSRGIVTFDYAGRRYRLERRFGTSNGRDGISLLDDVSGQPLELPTGRQPGEMLFQLSAEAFKRSLFVGAAATVISAEAKSDALVERLLNRDSGEADASYRSVLGRLETAKRELLSASGKQGEIAEITGALEQLQVDLEAAIQREQAMAALQEKLAAQERSAAAVEADIEALMRRRRSLTDQLRQFEHERRAEAHLSLRRRIARRDALKRQLTAGGMRIDSTRLERLSRLMSMRAEAIYQTKLLKDQFEVITEADGGMPGDGLTQEMLDFAINAVGEQRAETAQLRHRIADQNQEAISTSKAIAQRLSGWMEDEPKKIREAELPGREEDRMASPRRRKCWRAVCFIGAALILALLTIIGINRIVSTPMKLSIEMSVAGAAVIVAAATVAVLVIRLRTRSEVRGYRNEAKLISGGGGVPQAAVLSESSIHTMDHAALMAERQRQREIIQRTDRELDRLSLRLETLDKRQRDLLRLEERLDQSTARMAEADRALLTEFGIEDAREGDERIEGWRRQMEELTRLNEELAQIQRSDPQAYEQALSGATVPEDVPAAARTPSDSVAAVAEAIDRIMAQIRDKQGCREALLAEIAAQRSACIDENRGKHGVNALLERRDELTARLTRKRRRLTALETAKDALETAYTGLTRAFGPQLSARTAEIFTEMTGLERRVRIDAHFAVSVEDERTHAVLPWEKLSSGTLDQVYLALRLALVEQLEGAEPLPVFLDDALVYFDDDRAMRTFRFLERYARTRGAQVLFFTCHRRFVRASDRTAQA